MNKTHTASGVIVLLITAVIWGFAFVFQVQTTLGAFWFNGIRFPLGILTLIPVILIFERKPLPGPELKRLWLYGFLAGLCLFTASTLQMFGIALSKNSAKAGFITGFYLILVPLMAWLFFRNALRWGTLIGALFGVAGLFFLNFQSLGSFSVNPGDLLILACSVFFAFQILIIDRYAQSLPSFKFTTVEFMTVAILSLIAAPIFERETVLSLETLRVNLPSLLFCGILSCGVAYTGQVVGQKHVEPSLSCLLMCSESVFAAVGGAIILHENLGWIGYLGCALVFCGILISGSKLGSREIRISSRHKTESDIQKGEQEPASCEQNHDSEQQRPS